jgi:hypothetical protein
MEKDAGPAPAVTETPPEAPGVHSATTAAGDGT